MGAVGGCGRVRYAKEGAEVEAQIKADILQTPPEKDTLDMEARIKEDQVRAWSDLVTALLSVP